jgi:adenylate cyclase
MPAEMPINLADEADFALGSLNVRPSFREVMAGDRTHVLEPRVMQVLVLLARHHGQTVSRDQLVEACWGGVIVGENAIQRCIGLLRKLAEATVAFEIITLARVGYRLNVQADEATSRQPERLLAVLPFDNLSNDPDFDYFADGVSEEILQSISRTSSIKVIGRTSSFQYRGNNKVIPRIAQELGATHLLDGSVRRSGETLRVSAHLMELSDQTMLWADRFDGDIANPFDLQDAVARGAVGALSGMISESATHENLSGPGFDALLRLRRLLNDGSIGIDDEAAIAAVEQLSPDSAEAWGTVAKVRATQRWTTGRAQGPELREAAQAAAERALTIDPANGAAHKALFLLEPPAGRFLAREKQLERARVARPEDGELLWALYVHYLSVGRLDLSGQMAEEAYRIDPLRPMNVIGYANSLYTAGETTQAMALMRHAIDRWPTDATIFVIAIWTAGVHNELDFVDAILKSDWQSRYPERAQFFVNRVVGVVKGILNAPDHLLQESLRHIERSSSKGEAPIGYVALCAFLGADLDALYDVVDHMPIERLREPDALLPPLDGLPNLFLRINARLRQSPRFVQLCRRLGLVDYWQETGKWPECVDEVSGYYNFLDEARS